MRTILARQSTRIPLQSDSLQDVGGAPRSEKKNPVSDPEDIVAAAIRSAFVSYPKKDDPDWRSPNWIKPEECAHLTKMIMQHLKASGFEIARKASKG
jgi:hypothetical protein